MQLTKHQKSQSFCLRSSSGSPAISPAPKSPVSGRKLWSSSIASSYQHLKTAVECEIEEGHARTETENCRSLLLQVISGFPASSGILASINHRISNISALQAVAEREHIALPQPVISTPALSSMTFVWKISPLHVRRERRLQRRSH